MPFNQEQSGELYAAFLPLFFEPFVRMNRKVIKGMQTDGLVEQELLGKMPGDSQLVLHLCIARFAPPGTANYKIATNAILEKLEGLYRRDSKAVDHYEKMVMDVLMTSFPDYEDAHAETLEMFHSRFAEFKLHREATRALGVTGFHI